MEELMQKAGELISNTDTTLGIAMIIASIMFLKQGAKIIFCTLLGLGVIYLVKAYLGIDLMDIISSL